VAMADEMSRESVADVVPVVANSNSIPGWVRTPCSLAARCMYSQLFWQGIWFTTVDCVGTNINFKWEFLCV
jgi:hypothetical protein